MYRSAIRLLAVSVLLASASSHAMGITNVQFSGQLRDVTTDEFGTPAAITFATLQSNGLFIGSQMSGSFVMDTSVPDEDPDPTRGQFSNALLEGTLTAGALEFEHVSSPFYDTAFTRNDAPGGFNDFFAVVPNYRPLTPSSSITVNVSSFSLRDDTRAALPSDAFPAEDRFHLSLWNEYAGPDVEGTGLFLIARVNTDTVYLFFDLDELQAGSVTPVPVPAAGVSLLFAITSLLGLRRRATLAPSGEA